MRNHQTFWPIAELVFLAAIFPLALFPRLNIWLGAAAAGILLFWAARFWWERRLWPATPLNLPLAVLLVMIGVSLWATYDIPFSLGKVAGLTYGIALFLAVSDLLGRSQKWWHLGLALFLSTSLAVIGLGILGTHWSPKMPLLGRIAIFFNQIQERLPPLPLDDFNPNQIGGVLLWTAPAALAAAAALLVRPSLRQRLSPAGRRLLLPALGLLALANFTILILSQSRSAWLGLAAALLWMGWLAAGRRLRPALLVAGLLLLAAAGLFLWGNGPAVLGGNRLEALGLREGAVFDASGEGLGTLNGRLEIWSRAIYGIEDFPFTGMGMNTFRQVVHILYPLFSIGPEVDVAHAHNHLLQVGLDLGIPGLVAYLAVWWGSAAMLHRSWRRSGDPWSRALAAGLSGSLLAYWIYGLTDAVSLGAKPGFIFWLLLALITTHHQLQTPTPNS